MVNRRVAGTDVFFCGWILWDECWGLWDVSSVVPTFMG